MNSCEQNNSFKICNKCKAVLSIENFYKLKLSKDGYNPTCKKCIGDRAKQGGLKDVKKRYGEKVYNHKTHVKQKKHSYIKNEYEDFVKNVKVHEKQETIKKTIGLTLCPVCKLKKANSQHHIIPRSLGGNDDTTNLIMLCRGCHDIVEMKTDEWIKERKWYNSDVLRSMIINLGM